VSSTPRRVLRQETPPAAPGSLAQRGELADLREGAVPEPDLTLPPPAVAPEDIEPDTGISLVVPQTFEAAAAG